MEATNESQQADRWVIFEATRKRLFRIALRMLRDPDDAEDVVQDAALRWLQADLTDVRAPTGWLVSVVTRLAVDRLRRAAKARQAYQDAWHVEPTRAPQSPDRPVELGSVLTTALLALRERLEPVERTVLVLREVFDCEYSEIARLVGKNAAACRQIVHRAHERVRRDRSRFAPRLAVTTDIVERFAAALSADDRQATLALLNDGATASAVRRSRDGSLRATGHPERRLASWRSDVMTASPAA